jgi:hypothetical protein
MKSIEEKFLSKVVIPSNEDDCWSWSGTKNSSGCGILVIDGKRWLASHVSYYLYVGDLPKAKILHVCSNSFCPSPLHLFSGERKDYAKYSRGFEYSSGLPGESNLNLEIVEEIIELLEQGVTITEIAKVCCVSYLIIYNIKHGYTWKAARAGRGVDL